MECSLCGSSEHQFSNLTKRICNSCSKKQWERDRLPVLISQGFYGYCKRCSKPKSQHYTIYCSQKCMSEALRELRPEANRICKNCDIHFRTNPAYIARRKSAGIYCSRKCFVEFQRSHPVRSVEKNDGYARLRQNREHRIVMEELLGRKLGTKEHVHHLNGNKSDNRIDNLLLITNSQHVRIHLAQRYNKPIGFYLREEDSEILIKLMSYN